MFFCFFFKKSFLFLPNSTTILCSQTLTLALCLGLVKSVWVWRSLKCKCKCKSTAETLHLENIGPYRLGLQLHGNHRTIELGNTGPIDHRIPIPSMIILVTQDCLINFAYINLSSQVFFFVSFSLLKVPFLCYFSLFVFSPPFLEISTKLRE